MYAFHQLSCFRILRRIRAAVCLVVCLAACAALVRPLQADATDKRTARNIILIMADDLGYHSLSVYGSDAFHTPNLDSLARSGMVFTQCHARAMCSPTRTVLLGGRTLDRVSMGQVPPQSMADLLAAEGLYCGFSGKWMQRNMPWNHGFAEGLVQVNWYKYYGPHFVVFNSGGYLREHNLPEPLPEKMLDRDLPVEGDQAHQSVPLCPRLALQALQRRPLLRLGQRPPRAVAHPTGRGRQGSRRRACHAGTGSLAFPEKGSAMNHVRSRKNDCSASVVMSGARERRRRWRRARRLPSAVHRLRGSDRTRTAGSR